MGPNFEAKRFGFVFIFAMIFVKECAAGVWEKSLMQFSPYVTVDEQFLLASIVLRLYMFLTYVFKK
jgi:hypothetical protein